MSKRKTDLQGRFRGVKAIDDFVDLTQRWWPVMLGAYGLAVAGYARATSLIPALSWADWSALVFVSSLILTGLTLWIFSVYRTWRMPPIPTHDRVDYFDEVLTLSDLVGGQEAAVLGKNFTRCIIRGPGQVRYQANVFAIYCSVEAENQFVTMAQNTNVSGSVMFVRCSFDRCHFENVSIFMTSQDSASIQREFLTLPTSEWKSKRWSD